MPAESNSFEKALRKYADHPEDWLPSSQGARPVILSRGFLDTTTGHFRDAFQQAERIYNVFTTTGIFRSLVADILHRTGEALETAGTLSTIPEGVSARLARVFSRWLLTRSPNYALLVSATLNETLQKEANALKMDFLVEIRIVDVQKSLRALGTGDHSSEPSLMIWVPNVANAIMESIRKMLETKAITPFHRPLNARVDWFDFERVLDQERQAKEAMAAKSRIAPK